MAVVESKEVSIPESFFEAAKNRVSHPVTGVFIIAWGVFNWRMLFFLVAGDSPAEHRINVALAYTNWKLGVVFPVIATLLYLLLSPLLQLAVSRYNGLITSYQASRDFEESLAEIQRQSELTSRRIATMEPVLRQQLQHKVAMEEEIARLTITRNELHTSITDFLSLQDPRFESLFKGMEQAEKSPDKRNQDRIQKNLSAQFKRLDSLKTQVQKRFPDFPWSS